MISFTVFGRPQPAGSKKAFPHKTTGRVVVVDAAEGSRPWKRQVAAAALEFAPRELLTGPIALELIFYVARPKGHYRTGRNADLLRDSAPPFPIARPDASKLTRAVEDALTGIVWRDDAQVVDQVVRKRFGAVERVEVRISVGGGERMRELRAEGRSHFEIARACGVDLSAVRRALGPKAREASERWGG